MKCPTVTYSSYKISFQGLNCTVNRSVILGCMISGAFEHFILHIEEIYGLYRPLHFTKHKFPYTVCILNMECSTAPAFHKWLSII